MPPKKKKPDPNKPPKVPPSGPTRSSARLSGRSQQGDGGEEAGAEVTSQLRIPQEIPEEQSREVVMAETVAKTPEELAQEAAAALEAARKVIADRDAEIAEFRAQQEEVRRQMDAEDVHSGDDEDNRQDGETEARVTTFEPTAEDRTKWKFNVNRGKRSLVAGDMTKRRADGSTIPVKLQRAWVNNTDLQITKNADGSEDVSKLDDEIFNMLKDLDEINGVDAYSNETQALGKLNPNQYLVLPSDLDTPIVPASEVGSGSAPSYFLSTYILAVYVMNQEIAPAGEDKVKFGMLRAEAVKKGWYDGQKEVIFKPVPKDLTDILRRDARAMRDCAADAMLASWLIPFAAEHVFRTQGHHYITNLSAEYLNRYSTIFQACLTPQIHNFLRPETLYHHALHWVSPARVWKVLNACLETDRIPEAIKLRRSSAPAGTAIITTTKVVFDALRAGGMLDAFKKKPLCDWALITAMDAKIRENPVKYHRVHNAYGMKALSDKERKDIAAAKDSAAGFSPIAKAFCDTMMRKAPLGNQQVLNKRAMDHPDLYMSAMKFFRGRSRMRPTTIDQLFAEAFDAPADEEDVGGGRK